MKLKEVLNRTSFFVYASTLQTYKDNETHASQALQQPFLSRRRMAARKTVHLKGFFRAVSRPTYITLLATGKDTARSDFSHRPYGLSAPSEALQPTIPFLLLKYTYKK